MAGARCRLGRGSSERASGFRRRRRTLVRRPIPRKGAAILDKWGIIVIPLCFLTVGIQTAVNAGAGLVRMRWSTYTFAMIPGCILWALLYGLGTLAVFAAAIRAVAGSPWGWAGLALIAMLIAAKIAWGRRERRTVNAARAADSADND